MLFFIRYIQKIVFFCLILLAFACSKKNYAHLKIPAQPTTIKEKITKTIATPDIPIPIDQDAIAKVAAEYAIYKKNVLKVVKNARSYIGTSYKFGGLDYKGIDCSGLVHVCLLEINKNIARMPDEQLKQGFPIDKNALKAGDLVFFGANKNSLAITHVGIITEVINPYKVLFVHASGKRGVVEDNFFHYHWQEVFIGATRPDYYGTETIAPSSLNK